MTEKTKFKAVLVIVNMIFNAIFYGLISFIGMSWNPIEWHVLLRIGFIICVIYTFYVIYLAIKSVGERNDGTK